MTPVTRRHAVARALLAAASLVITACSADAGVLVGTGSAQAHTEVIDEIPPTALAATAQPLFLPDVCEILTNEQLEEISGIDFAECTYDPGLSYDTPIVATFTHPHQIWPVVQVLLSTSPGLAAVQRQAADEWLGQTSDIEIAGMTDAYSVAGTFVAGDVGDVFVQVAWLSHDDADHVATVAQIAATIAAGM